MSLATAGIHCTISQSLSGAMEDCSIVGGDSRERSVAEGAECPRSFGSLWNVVIAVVLRYGGFYCCTGVLRYGG